MATARQQETTEVDRAAQKVFFSYSRSDAMLVDDLADRLEQAGFEPWIDYQQLVPGQPWAQQLDQAVDGADVVVVVISRRSVGSDNVANEWERALAVGKRVILVIAQAAELPSELADLEWVDVRTRYRSAVTRLVGAISDGPLEPAGPPPQDGFRAPLRVWAALLASMVTAAASLAALWTVLLPAILLPLPGRVARKSFNYTAVRNALLALPFAVIVTELAIVRSDTQTDLGLAIFLVAMLSAWSTFVLIRSGAFRRWVEPAAARPQWLGRIKELDQDRLPAPTRYAVDAAPEDEAYVRDVEQALEQVGHQRVDETLAGVVLRFVSRFNDVTEIDTDVITLPIIISEPDDELPARLRRTQWIDFRRGIDPLALDAMAHLLDQPEALLQTIGSPPPHNQRVLPKGVQGLFISLWIAVASILAFWVLVIVGLRSELGVLAGPESVWTVVLAGVAIGLMLGLTRSIRERRRRRFRAAYLPVLALAAFSVGIPLAGLAAKTQTSESGYGLDNAFVVPMIPAALLVFFWLFHSASLRRWIPPRSIGPHDKAGPGAG